jgi:NAD+ synthase (glutamine-hydrolysing)
VICNPAAFGETVGSGDYCKLMLQAQSARTRAGYILSCAGEGESTTDAVFGGQALIVENGAMLAERPAFSAAALTYSELDLDRLCSERRRANTASIDANANYLTIPFSLSIEETPLSRAIIAGEILPGSTLTIDKGDEGLTFHS